MAGVRQWLLGVVLTAFAGTLARQLAVGAKGQAMVRLTAGLLLTLAILRPIAALRWEAPAEGGLLERTEDQASDYRKNQQEALAAVIEEKTAAYIWDKANELGLSCEVHVTTAAGESGIPLPDAVTITGSYSPALAAAIEEGVGVPVERQYWLEESEWTRKESERG